MRVLYFSRDYTTHDWRFLSKFANSKHEVYFLRLEDDGIEYEARDLPTGIKEVSWEGGTQPKPSLDSWLRLVPHLEQVLESVKPDIIHAGPVQSTGFMTALTGFHPFALVSWGSDILVEADRDELWRWITQYTLRHSSVFVCDCDAVRKRAQQLVDYSEQRIVQFPWGIDLEQFYPGSDSMGLRDHLGWNDAFVILSTRTWEPIYGIDTLLDAFQKAHRQEDRLRLMLLGSGSLSDYVQSFIHKHSLSNVIYRPGMVSHSLLPDYFRATDLYITSSQSDGSSISLLEAMATGLPIIATDSQGNREWLEDEWNGWLFPVADADHASQAILAATMISSDQRLEISNINRSIAEQKANWENNFLKLMRVYDRIEKQF